MLAYVSLYSTSFRAPKLCPCGRPSSVAGLVKERRVVWAGAHVLLTAARPFLVLSLFLMSCEGCHRGSFRAVLSLCALRVFPGTCPLNLRLVPCDCSASGPGREGPAAVPAECVQEVVVMDSEGKSYSLPLRVSRGRVGSECDGGSSPHLSIATLSCCPTCVPPSMCPWACVPKAHTWHANASGQWSPLVTYQCGHRRWMGWCCVFTIVPT